MILELHHQRQEDALLVVANSAYDVTAQLGAQERKATGLDLQLREATKDGRLNACVCGRMGSEFYMGFFRSSSPSLAIIMPHTCYCSL